MQGIDRYLSPLALRRAEWLVPSDWLGHVPFAFWLIETLRPDTVVELGAQDGVSYFAFCQAVQACGTPTACYAIDSWRGEDSRGAYGDHLYRTLADYHDPRYGHFSRLIRSRSDDALDGFADGTIDLLHLHGNHNYEAALHDFQRWQPKMSAKGVVLLHGITIEERGLGVARLWRDLSTDHPASFSFLHSGGLGLLALGATPPPAIGDFLKMVNTPETAAEIREVYGRIGESYVTEQDLTAKLDRAVRRHDQLLARFDALQLQHGELATHNQRHIDQIGQWQTAHQALQAAFDELRANYDNEQARSAALEDALKQSRQQIENIFRSRSWRYSMPLRAVTTGLQRVKDLFGNAAEPVVVPTAPPTDDSLEENKRDVRSTPALTETVILSEAKDLSVSGDPSAFGLRMTTRGSLFLPSSAGLRTGVGSDADVSPASPYLDLKEELADAEARRLADLPITLPAFVRVDAGDLPAAIAALTFPHSSDPAVSIIVSLSREATAAVGCLTSLCRHSDERTPYEVIVVGAGSTDDVAATLGQVPNIVLLPNPDGLDPVSCRNMAAVTARGHYLLFLDDAVQVTSGWLAALLEGVAGEERIGAAGPLFIGPDGRVRNAGMALNPDGSVIPIGHGDAPDQPRFRFRRPVDYCSASCLMVEAQAFRRLGGFDVSFAGNGYEDPDFCLRLRQTGLDVVCTPEAAVVGAEGGNGGRPLTSALPSNRQRLLEGWQAEIDALNDTRLIAFYHPQFYPTAETDRWWGAGFTEWQAVAALQEQGLSRRPADLGYYDLRLADIMEAQADLARRYGLFGFCYAYYWFAGKRLFEMPIERLLASGKPDLPFCLCWENSDWTRTPDGAAPEILIAEEHSEADDEAVIFDLIRYFRLAPYIRINGRPLLLVRDVGSFPRFSQTAETWRRICREEGLGEIHLAMVETAALAAAAADPAQYGCDSSVESPVETALPAAPAFPGPDDPDLIADCRQIVKEQAARALPGHRYFPGVAPWRNGVTHRHGKTIAIEGASPDAFQLWLETAIRRTREQNFGDSRIVFADAWNAWAEGAYLEPDHQDGHAYLEAVRNALDAWYLNAPADRR